MLWYDLHMTKTLEKAITVIRTLPETAQDSIGQSMLDAAARHRKLNDDLVLAEAQLDAGQGIPAEEVLADLKARHGV